MKRLDLSELAQPVLMVTSFEAPARAAEDYVLRFCKYAARSVLDGSFELDKQYQWSRHLMCLEDSC